jgi:hypothetical protein
MTGVNSLAFPGAQHGAFCAADADCVGVTGAVPWALSRRRLDLLARGGTPLFVSLAQDVRPPCARGPAERDGRNRQPGPPRRRPERWLRDLS